MDTTSKDKEMEKIDIAKEVIRNAKRVVIFTGAGMSADSGIATFRKSSGGFWEGVFGYIALPIFGTPVGWNIMPGISWRNYIHYFYEPIARAKPHLGHELLAKLEKVKSSSSTSNSRRNAISNVGIITMNVDGYHSLAGNTWVAEVHGTVQTNRCSSKNKPCSGQNISCNVEENSNTTVTTTSTPSTPSESNNVKEKTDTLLNLRCPLCNAYPRPNAVLFTENLPQDEWEKATNMVNILEKGDVFIIIGTTGVVYPAAGIPERVIASKTIFTIEINLDPSPISNKVDCYIEGKAKDVLVSLLEELVQ